VIASELWGCSLDYSVIFKNVKNIFLVAACFLDSANSRKSIAFRVGWTFFIMEVLMRNDRFLGIVGVLGMIFWGSSGAIADKPYFYDDPIMSVQVGSSSYDYSNSIAVDPSGNVFIAGYTGGSLFGTLSGSYDAFMAKYNGEGTREWAKQVGGGSVNAGWGITTDSSGNVYFPGSISGSVFGSSAGGVDIFLVKYDDAGNTLWYQKDGTAQTDNNTCPVALDSSGNIYFAGATNGSFAATNAGTFDALLIKYDNAGNILWSRQKGTSGIDAIRTVIVNTSDNVYVCGETSGSLYGGTYRGDYDAFLAKYDGQGNLLWSQQIGTSGTDYGYSIASDSSDNVYICGATAGSLYGTNAGSSDVFLAKYDGQGNLLWSQQIGTSGADYGYSVAADDSDNVHICGYTSGSLYGTNSGSSDIFLAEFNSSGTLLWSKQFGTTAADVGRGMAVDSDGNIYCTGWTAGSLYGTNAGSYDSVIAKFAAVLPGDANLDGYVDVGDLGILSANYGMATGATWSMGDFNNDGAVDLGDLGILSAHYGESIYD
jgi:hypothetical protein